MVDMKCKLTFDITCRIDDSYADELGEELSVWLLESWFNGEDVLDVEFKGYEVIN